MSATVRNKTFGGSIFGKLINKSPEAAEEEAKVAVENDDLQVTVRVHKVEID